MKQTATIFIILYTLIGYSQNPLFIPPIIESNSISLTLSESTHEFFSGITTNTMGANGNILGPTLIMNKGEMVNISVQNQLNDTTTIHWHGLHVSPLNDGGPHTKILPGGQWNPQFTVLDKAGTYWYHPHLHMKTGMHVSKGIAGMLLVRDDEEASLNLPTSYGVDEFPVILQTKGFDSNNQIEHHTDLDDVPMVNATVNAIMDMPSQVVRLRVLNGASQRVMELGFSDNRIFHLIGTDGGLLNAPLALSRYRISPGQRADILVDLTGQFGSSFSLMSFGSELPNAIYGAAQPGMGPGATGSLPDYTSNPLNGNDYALLQINVVGQTADPITSVPSQLANFLPLNENDAVVTRSLTFTSAVMGNLAGPFFINGSSFQMDVVNFTIPLDNIEIWSLTNQTPIAHPFHIHDVQFMILDINGIPPPPELQGWNDVVLVPAGMGNVRFIAQFSDHANNNIPYMFHCHMLPHEDMGMMGQFIVSEPIGSVEDPASMNWDVHMNANQNTVSIITETPMSFKIYNLRGEEVWKGTVFGSSEINLASYAELYIIRASDGTSRKFFLNN